jgi:hypothetical protein
MQEMYVTMENLMFQGRKKLANYDNSWPLGRAIVVALFILCS